MVNIFKNRNIIIFWETLFKKLNGLKNPPQTCVKFDALVCNVGVCTLVLRKCRNITICMPTKYTNFLRHNVMKKFLKEYFDLFSIYFHDIIIYSYNHYDAG